MIKKQTEEPSEHGPSCDPLFVVLRDAVKAYPAHNDKFVEFMVELQDISFPGGTFRGQMYKMGQDLTEFEFGQIEPSPFNPNIISKSQGYINLCAFVAKLHNHGIRTADSISDLSRGAQVLVEALEKAPWEKYHHEDIEAYLPQEDEIEDEEDEDFYEEKRDELLAKKDIRILDRRVPGAAQWVFICAREIYGMLGVHVFGEEDRGSMTTCTGRRGGRGDGGGFGEVSVGFWCYGFGSGY